MNKLECPLCRSQFDQPHMCPHCSEVYCFKCIRSYLDRYYFCPSCDHHVIELVDCSRLINEVKEKIKESDLKKNNDGPSMINTLCPEHSLPLKYHCTTCKQDICSDCGLISQKHKTHKIQPIQSIKSRKNIISGSQLKQIKQKIAQKLCYFQEQQKRYLLQLQLLKSQIKYNKTKIYEYYEELILRLQRQTQILLKDIQLRIHQCSKQISEQQKVKEKLQSIEKKSVLTLEMQMKSQLVLIEDKYSSIEIPDKELYKYLLDKNFIKTKDTEKNERKRRTLKRHRNFLKKQSQVEKQERIQEKQDPFDQFSHPSILFDKKIYELGIMYLSFYLSKEINLPLLDYSILKDEDVIYSPNFKVFGYEWRLKIYPKGNAQALNEYLSVFLELVNVMFFIRKSPEALTSNSSKEYFFRLELLNLNQAGKSVIKEYNSRFCVGECWGYAQFAPLRQVKEYLHDGKLLFVMGVRNVSYFDLCQNMKKYVSKLQGETKVLSELCQNYYVGNNSVSNLQNESNLSETSSQNSYILQHPNRHTLVNEDEISSIISSIDDN